MCIKGACAPVIHGLRSSYSGNTASRLLRPHAILYGHRDNMRSNRHIAVLGPISSQKRWTQAFARALAPFKYLRVLPTRTRPSLFGSD